MNMNKEEFFKFVEQNIKAHFPMEYQDVIIKSVNNIKANCGELHGLQISRMGESLNPILYLDEYYEMYKSGEMGLFHIMENLVGVFIKAEENKKGKDVNSMVEKFMSYDTVKRNLCMRLCEYVSNKEYLQGRVYTREGDFARTYHVLLERNDSESFSISVTDDLLERWGKTKEELHQDALQADIPENRPVLYHIEEVMLEILKELDHDPVDFLKKDSLEDIRSGLSIWVLTNERRLNGAAMITHQEVLEKIGKMFGEDYYVLPSSQHEMILVPAEGADPVYLHEMVKEINQREVAAVDWLSDRVQYYDTTEHVLENALDRVERIEKQQKKQSEKIVGSPKRPSKEFGPTL